jgi:glycolate oxidase FAD binding subunit
VVPSFVASPASTEEAAALLRAAAEADLAVVPRGAGSRLGWGTPASRCDLVVDTRRMDSVVEHASGDLVARVQAGARVGDVASVLAEAGQEIALDVPATATVGGVVASGLCGPRRLRYGSPRDLLIGITVVRADGTVARSGGKVVKNVAGYDLGKLLAGSRGTLGLITEATFRLHPLPGARAYVMASFADVAGLSAASAASAAVARAANSPLVASAVEIWRPTAGGAADGAAGGPVEVAVLLEGSADGVAARASRMADLLGSARVAAEPPAWWTAGPPGGTAGSETLIQVSFWVSALSAVLDAVDAAARDLGVFPEVSGAAGAGMLYVRPHPEPTAARFVGALRSALGPAPSRTDGSVRGPARGSVQVLAAPTAVREALGDVGGMTGTMPSLSLMRAVKYQFDPHGRMSPGRFTEGA